MRGRYLPGRGPEANVGNIFGGNYRVKVKMLNCFGFDLCGTFYIVLFYSEGRER